MRRLSIILFIHFCLLVSVHPLNAIGTPTDTIRASLLTCGAGDEIYSLFGHTAIRIQQPAKGIDVVYNYGLFSFDTPNFILRFTLGETDYLLGRTSYKRFASEYLFTNRDVWEQELNLTNEEKRILFSLLEENLQPENREYRYNFFYDNCATRPRDQIELALKGKLRYKENMTESCKDTTYRSMIYQYTTEHPWSRFGIDFCLGSEADKPINRRQMMFIPFCLSHYFHTAQISRENNLTTPLTKPSIQLITSGSDDSEKGSIISPMQACWSLFLLLFALTCYGIKKRKTLWGIDLILFFLAGVVGCIIAFLALFSQHPAVSPNYLLFIFHPLHLICLPWIVYQVAKGQRSPYLMANLIILTLFILLWGLLPQKINEAVLPLALCLLIRSASNLILNRLKK